MKAGDAPRLYGDVRERVGRAGLVARKKTARARKARNSALRDRDVLCMRTYSLLYTYWGRCSSRNAVERKL